MIEPASPAADSLFLSWFDHRRTREIAGQLGIPLRVLATRRRGLGRYLELAWRTVAELRRTRPRLLIVQSPSLVLSLLALALRPILHYALVIDAHNEAVEPYLHPYRVIRLLTYRVLRAADLIVVSNSALASRVESLGGRAHSLPDRIPSPGAQAGDATTPGFNVVLVCTYAGDEPVAAVIESARRSSDVRFTITGDSSRLAPQLRESLPPNVHLTGYLPEDEYWRLLASSDIVMDLTTMEDCLVCGAYEGLAAGKPLVLSNNRASVELFHDAALFTDNSVDSLVQAVRTARHQYPALVERLPRARARIEATWTSSATALVSRLQRLAASPRH